MLIANQPNDIFILLQTVGSKTDPVANCWYFSFDVKVTACHLCHDPWAKGQKICKCTSVYRSVQSMKRLTPQTASEIFHHDFLFFINFQ